MIAHAARLQSLADAGALPDAMTEDQVSSLIREAFGTTTVREGFLRAHDAVLNPVVSVAERERLCRIMSAGLRLLALFHAGNTTRVAETIGVSRATCYAMQEHCTAPAPH